MICLSLSVHMGLRVWFQQNPPISALMTQCVVAEATGFGHMLTFLLMNRN